MKKVAVVYGGNSLEHDISIITAMLVMEELKKNKIDYLPIYISHDDAFYTGKALLDKDNYEHKRKFIKGSFTYHRGYYQFKYRHHYVPIDVAVLCVHGAGVEDGTLKALFDFMKIPSTSSGILSSALMQDKYFLKKILKEYQIPVVDGYYLNKDDDYNIPEEFTFPLIIKPVHLGSSIGVKKVNTQDEYLEHLKVAFNYDNAVIVEKVVKNLKELNIAVMGSKKDYQVSEIEMVNTKDTVLSFKDKYELFKSKTDSHIIPANITNVLKKKIEQYAALAFQVLDCKGIVRFDFLFDSKSKEIYLNEINAIPGSLAYYLFKNKNLQMIDIVQKIIETAKNEYNMQRHLTKTYEYANLKSISQKK